MTSITAQLDAEQTRRYNAGKFIPACGGTEVPFTFLGKRYLYCWHTLSRIHRYIDLDTDMPMPADWTPSVQ